MSDPINPEGWTRMPPNGKSFMGMSRSILYRLHREGKLRISAVVHPGRKSGLTYFAAADVVALIRASAKPSIPVAG